MNAGRSAPARLPWRAARRLRGPGAGIRGPARAWRYRSRPPSAPTRRSRLVASAAEPTCPRARIASQSRTLAATRAWRSGGLGPSRCSPRVAPRGTLTIQSRPREPISRSVLAAIPDQREQQRCASQKSRYLCAQNSTINSRKPSMNRTDPCGSLVLPTLTPGLAHGAGSSRNTAWAQEYRTSRPAAQKRSPRRTNCQCLRRVRREPLCPRRGHRGPGSVRCVRALLQCGLLAASGCNMA